MYYDHWFVSRQKRNLTSIFYALVAYSDVCRGKVWPGNAELQLEFEDELATRSITAHGKLRARKNEAGGGGTRTLIKQMKDLGLIFVEDENKHCQLTLIGEALVKSEISFVGAMRLQLQRYQYPSATSWKGNGGVNHDFKVHPFQFLFRLMRDERLGRYLSVDDVRYVVIHYARNDSEACFEDVINRILHYRESGETDRPDDEAKTYWNIANTFINYISLTQYVDRAYKKIMIRRGKEKEVDDFIQEKPRFIPHPETAENYLRAYGRGTSAKDLRDFENQKQSQKEIVENRIRTEYALLALRTPITEITPDVVHEIVMATGIDEKIVESFLVRVYPHGNIDDFFVTYRELANLSQAYATEFEAATCELFKKIFKLNAKHVGPKGNTPDVYFESDEYGYCGIVDCKAYKKGYSVSGDEGRRMIDMYIPNIKEYGGSKYPLAVFTYVSGSFGKNIDVQIEKICEKTGVSGSAMPVDILIDIAQDYAEMAYNHNTLRNVFSVNREVRLADLPKYK